MGFEITCEKVLWKLQSTIQIIVLFPVCVLGPFFFHVLISKALAYTASKNFPNCFLMLAFILIMTPRGHRKLNISVTLKLVNLLKPHFLNFTENF